MQPIEILKFILDGSFYDVKARIEALNVIGVKVSAYKHSAVDYWEVEINKSMFYLKDRHFKGLVNEQAQ